MRKLTQPAAQVNPSTSSAEDNRRIHRVRSHKRDYLTIYNSTLQDERLSWEAIGLLVYLLSLPADWEIKVSHLQTRGGRWLKGKDDGEPGRNQGTGRDSVRRLLKELQEFGYASGVGRESQGRVTRGRFAQTDIQVYEEPAENPFYFPENPPSTENQSTVDSPSTETPSTDSPSTVNQATYKEQSPQRTHGTKTHTTQGHLRAVGAPAAADGGVCVCKTPHGSEFCDRERIDLASRQPTIKSATDYAMCPAVRAGRDDATFHLWRQEQAPEAIELKRAAPPDNRMPYGAALQLVGSVVSSAGPGAAAAEIARLFESGQIGGQTRDRLAARPWDVITGGDGGGAPEAHRSHHPMDDATGVG